MASALAGIGMLAGLIVFVLGKSVAAWARGEAPQSAAAKRTEWYALRRRPRRRRGDLGADPVSGRHPDPADRLGHRAARLRALRERSSSSQQPRDRMFAILFLIALNPLFWGLFEQAGGSINLYTDRFVDRAGVPGVAVPVDQPDLHHPAGAAVRRRCGSRSASAGSSPRRRPSSAWRCSRSARASWSSSGAPSLAVGPEAMTPVIFVFLSTCCTPPASSACRRSASAR